MQRRKFLIGAGSLAAGTAGAIGTGAFTSVEADRTINVDVVGDGSAYLSISGEDTPNGNHYVDESANSVQIDLNGQDNSGGGDAFGDGLNDNANVKISNLLQITNQGTQLVQVGIAEPPLVSPGPIRDSSGNSISGGVFLDELQNTAGGSATEGGGGFSVPDDPVPLGVGRTVENIGLRLSDTSELTGVSDLTITFAAFTNDEFNSEFPGFSPNPVDP